MTQPNQLHYNSEIGKKVRECSAAGLTLKDTMAEIQSYAWAPRSPNSFYKYYSEDWYGPKNDITRQIGNKVANQAIDGDPTEPVTFKSQELWLRTQGGWSVKETVETREVGNEAEEEESAVDALMRALGKSDEDELGKGTDE